MSVPILPPVVSIVTWHGAAAYGLIRGGADVRWVAGAWLAIEAVVLTIQGGHSVFGTHMRLVTLSDLAMMAVCLGASLKARSYWMLAASMFAVLSVATDVAQLLRPTHSWTFGTVQLIWGYLFFAALIAATLAHQAARRGQAPA